MSRNVQRAMVLVKEIDVQVIEGRLILTRNPQCFTTTSVRVWKPEDDVDKIGQSFRELTIRGVRHLAGNGVYYLCDCRRCGQANVSIRKNSWGKRASCGCSKTPAQKAAFEKVRAMRKQVRKPPSLKVVKEP